MFRSSNRGVSFSVAGTPGASTANHPWESALPRTVPGLEGHVWVPLGRNGLKYSTDHGETYTTLSSVTYCKSIGIGKAMSGAGYPTVFIWGTVSGITGLFRSTDQGATWLRINDDMYEFGGAPFLIGDMNVAGRVYQAPGGGRGLIYWEPAVDTNTSVSSTKADGQDGFEIYPNPPTNGKFTVTLPLISGTAIVSIYDSRGKMLYQKNTDGLKKLDFDQHLNSGVYFIRVSTNKFDITRKLIVNQ